ncbi:Aspartic peptidase domain superfamily [Sesbania bispinosa]|nr:Aspartic peptidase domain superfamily [Sesbania bispinosa]
MARFLPESVRDGLAHEFERLEQTEGMPVSDLSSDKRRKEAVAKILARNSGLRDHRVVIPVLIRSGEIFTDHFSTAAFGVTFTPCPTCGRLHIGACFGDSGSGKGSGGRGQAQSGRGQARVFVMTRQDAQASNAVVTVATQLGKSPSSLDETLDVTTPVGEILLADCVYRSCVVSIGGKELFANLIALDMVDFDVILGMDWLASHYATLDCHNKVVKFEMPGEYAFSFQGEQG